MSFEPTEFADSENIQDAKVAMFNYIVFLGDKLEEMEKLGKTGSLEIFSILNELKGSQNELELYSTEAHESMPPKNYEDSAEKIIVKYLPKIIDTQISELSNNKGDGEWKEKINELVEIVGYYNDIYPELGFEMLLNKLSSI